MERQGTIDTTQIRMLGNYDERYKTRIFLYAAILHKNNVINDAKLKAMNIQAFGKRIYKPHPANKEAFIMRVTKLFDESTIPNQFKRTYHEKITDTWYNDENLLFIYEDVLKKTVPSAYLTIEELLYYTNRLLNASRNYCIDWLWHNLFYPLCDYCLNNDTLALLGSFLNVRPELTDKQYWASSDSYCCEDCDGPRSEYRQREWVEYVNKQLLNHAKHDVFSKFQKRSFGGKFKDLTKS